MKIEMQTAKVYQYEFSNVLVLGTSHAFCITANFNKIETELQRNKMYESLNFANLTEIFLNELCANRPFIEEYRITMAKYLYRETCYS